MPMLKGISENLAQSVEHLHQQQLLKANKLIAEEGNKENLEILLDSQFSIIKEIEKFSVSQQKVLLLSGDDFSGKTLLTQQLLLRLLHSSNAWQMLPIYIDLDNLIDIKQPIIDKYLEETYKLTAENLNELKKQDKTIFIFDHYGNKGVCVNLYVTQQLSTWNGKSIIVSDKKYLSKYSDYKPCFIPYQNQRRQIELYAELISPASSMDISKESPDKEIDQNYSTSEVKTSILQNTVNQSFKNRSLQISYQPESNKSTSDYEELLSHPLNERLSTHDINVMRHLASQVQKDSSFKKALYELIFASRDESRLSRAAANAITALNYAKASLSGIDFSGCDITGADLRGAILDHANFSGANLTNVDLQGACIRKTNFSGAKMYGVNFGEKPYYRILNPIIKSQLLSDDSVLSVVHSKKEEVIYIYHNGTKSPICFEGFSNVDNYSNQIFINVEGSLVAVIDNNHHAHVHLFEICSGVKLKTFVIPKESVTAITLSRDNQLLAVASAGNIYIFDVVTGDLFTANSTKEDDQIINLTFNNTDDLLVSMHENDEDPIFQLWEIRRNSKQILHKLFLHSDNFVTQLKEKMFSLSSGQSPAVNLFSADGRYLITGYSSIKIWFLTTLNLLYEIKSQDNNTSNCIALSSNNRYLAVGFGKIIKIYNFEDGKLLCSLEGHAGEITGLMFNLDEKRLMSSDIKGFIRFWDCTTFDKKQFSKDETSIVNIAIVSPDNKFLAVANGGKLSLWIIAKWLKLCTIDIDKWGITHLSFHSNSQSLAMSGKFSNAIHVFDIKSYLLSREVIIQHYCGDYHVKEVKLDSLNSIVENVESIGKYSTKLHTFGIKIPSLMTRDEYVQDVVNHFIHDHGMVNFIPDYRVMSLALNDNYLVAGNADGSLHIWSLKSSSNIWPTTCTSPYHTSVGHELYLKGESTFQFLSGGLHVTCNKIDYIPATQQFIMVKSYSEDIKYNNNEVIVFDPSVHREGRLTAFGMHIDKNNKTNSSSNILPIVDFVRTEHFIFIAHKKKVIIIDQQTDQECSFNIKYEREITCIAVSPSNQYLSLGFSDNTLEIWEHNPGYRIHCALEIYGINGVILNISWFREENGLYFVTSSRDNIARCWRLMNSGEHLDAMLCWSSAQNSLEAYHANIANVDGLSEDDQILLSQHNAQGNPITSKESLSSSKDDIKLFDNLELSCRRLGIFTSSKKIKLPPMPYLTSFLWWETKNDENHQIVRIRTDFPKAAKRFQQGNQAIIENELDKAIRFFQRAIEINDKVAIFHQQVAYCYWLKAIKEKRDYYQEVSESFKAALKIEANTKLYMFCALYLFQDKSYYEEALLYLDKIVNSFLKNGNDQLYFIEQNKILLPLELQSQILGIKKTQIDIIFLSYYLFIQIYFSLSDRVNANKYLYKFINDISKKPTSMSYSLLGFCHRSLGNYEEAAHCFMQAYNIDKNHPFVEENARASFALAGIDVSEENEATQIASSANQDDEEDQMQRAIALSLRSSSS